MTSGCTDDGLARWPESRETRQAIQMPCWGASLRTCLSFVRPVEKLPAERILFSEASTPWAFPFGKFVESSLLLFLESPTGWQAWDRFDVSSFDLCARSIYAAPTQQIQYDTVATRLPARRREILDQGPSGPQTHVAQSHSTCRISHSGLRCTDEWPQGLELWCAGCEVPNGRLQARQGVQVLLTLYYVLGHSIGQRMLI